jgi:hypothetical protein
MYFRLSNHFPWSRTNISTAIIGNWISNITAPDITTTVLDFISNDAPPVMRAKIAFKIRTTARKIFNRPLA